MSADENMKVNERRQVHKKVQQQDSQAGRKDKARILDQLEKVLGRHRSSIGRPLNGDLKRQLQKRQRGRTNGLEVQSALMVVAESLDYVCTARLKPNLVWLVPFVNLWNDLCARSDLRG